MGFYPTKPKPLIYVCQDFQGTFLVPFFVHCSGFAVMMLRLIVFRFEYALVEITFKLYGRDF